MIQRQELGSRLIPPYDLLVRDKGLGWRGNTVVLVLCCDFFFKISEMSLHVYLVNLLSREVGKHKHSECEQPHPAGTPGRFAEVHVSHCKQHVGQ